MFAFIFFLLVISLVVSTEEQHTISVVETTEETTSLIWQCLHNSYTNRSYKRCQKRVRDIVSWCMLYTYEGNKIST